MTTAYSKAQTEGIKKLVDALFEESKSKAEAIIGEAIQRSKLILDESEKYALKHSEETFSSFAEMAAIESRKEVSKAEIDTRMDLLRLKESYVEKVFEETRKKLADFTESSEYKSFMLDNLTSLAKSMAIGQVLLNEDDIRRLGEKNVQKAAGSGAEIKEQSVGIGGFIVISKDGKASVDRTIDGILRSEKEKLRGKIAEQLFR
ncbi:MAG: hypothetical protein LUP94_03000 [Candidatus Methanomethylicus sp.]|nr:hypothetical protein [Candidatus Methanomethylicus sp.]